MGKMQMTVDLPKLKIGCGVHLDFSYLNCGELKGTVTTPHFCHVCLVIRDKVLPVLKAHAAAHQKLMVKYARLKNMKPFDLRYEQGARDAVLVLAGLTKEDLKSNEKSNL